MPFQSELPVGAPASDTKAGQAERAKLKAQFRGDLDGYASELLIGAQEGTDEARREREARKAAEAAEKAANIEKLAKEIALLESEITSIQGIIDNEERNTKERSRVAQGGPAAVIYEQSIALRNTEIANLRGTLSSAEANLNSDQLRELMEKKQEDLVNTKEFRDGLLDD